MRLSGSGLGCPDWPKCHGKIYAPLETHAWIEFGNRLVSGVVGLACVLAGLGAFRRRPFRRDMAYIGLLLPLGVISQAVLGGFTVRHHLAPGFVMAHYLLDDSGWALYGRADTALTYGYAESKVTARALNPGPIDLFASSSSTRSRSSSRSRYSITREMNAPTRAASPSSRRG